MQSAVIARLENCSTWTGGCRVVSRASSMPVWPGSMPRKKMCPTWTSFRSQQASSARRGNTLLADLGCTFLPVFTGIVRLMSQLIHGGLGTLGGAAVGAGAGLMVGGPFGAAVGALGGAALGSSMPYHPVGCPVPSEPGDPERLSME